MRNCLSLLFLFLVLTACSGQPPEEPADPLPIGSQMIPLEAGEGGLDRLLTQLNQGITDSTVTHFALSGRGEPLEFSAGVLPTLPKMSLEVGVEAEQWQANFLLFSSLNSKAISQAASQPLGPALVVLSHSPERAGFPPFAVLVHGDIGLYDAFLGHWHSLHQPASSQSFRQLHTYSDTHDHRAWFFPHPEAKDSSTTILSNLIPILNEMRKPTKIRISMPQWDDAHLDLAEKLVRMANDYEVDMGILMGNSAEISADVQSVMKALPPGKIRYAEQADLPAFWLLDGPVVKTEDAFPERNQVVCMGSHAWTQTGNRGTLNFALSLFDKAIFSQLEAKWLEAWKSAALIPERGQEN